MYKLVLAWGLAFFAATSPSLAEDKIFERFGPVEVNEPVLGNLGPNALIAFYNLEEGKCAVQVLTWQRADTEAIGASRSRVSLNPEQQMHIDSIADSLTLQCGKDASSIMLIPPVLSAGFGTEK
jgi:hypothetical protein